MLTDDEVARRAVERADRQARETLVPDYVQKIRETEAMAREFGFVLVDAAAFAAVSAAFGITS